MNDEERIRALLGAIHVRWSMNPDLTLGLVIDELIFTLGIESGTSDDDALDRILAFTGGIQSRNA